MNNWPKSINNLSKKHLKKIASISDERSNGDGFWIYLKDGFADMEFDPHQPTKTIHEQTITECIARLKSAVEIKEG